MEISIGYYTLPAILMVILGIIYKSVPTIPDRWKSVIAVGVGMLLGIGAMFYSEQPVVPKLVIEYLLLGLMGGAASTGLYEGQKAITSPRK